MDNQINAISLHSSYLIFIGETALISQSFQSEHEFELLSSLTSVKALGCVVRAEVQGKICKSSLLSSAKLSCVQLQ